MSFRVPVFEVMCFYLLCITAFGNYLFRLYKEAAIAWIILLSNKCQNFYMLILKFIRYDLFLNFKFILQLIWKMDHGGLNFEDIAIRCSHLRPLEICFQLLNGFPSTGLCLFNVWKQQLSMLFCRSPLINKNYLYCVAHVYYRHLINLYS